MFDFELWFTSRGRRVLDYQKEMLSVKLPQAMAQPQPVVLAAAPSAGKTLMSIAFLDSYLQANPGHRVLVLTHGQTILRSQYAEEIELAKPGFTYLNLQRGSDIKSSTAQVIVSLPHTLVRQTTLPRFDLVVVDEAHQFYFAQMVEKILKLTAPKQHLLLTGTPSPFILRGGFTILPVSVSTLLANNMVEDLLVELSSSTYMITKSSYNEDDELKNDFKFNYSCTAATLDSVLVAIEKRLTSLFKSYPTIYSGLTNAVGWAASLKALRKTMIACSSQQQAKQVAEYFRKKGIAVALSISDTDDDSKEIARFKEDPKCVVLVVAKRGILGFNLPEMENVVDLTCGHNIDRIFQLMCRVLRKHPQGRKKLFVKVTPHSLEEYFRHVMSGVVSLTDDEYYTKYNGKNFLDMKLPAMKSASFSDGAERGEGDSGWSSKKKVLPISWEGIPVISLFQDILHKTHGPLNPYAYTTMQEVRDLLLNDRKSNGYWTLERCKESALHFNSRRAWYKGDRSAYETALKNGWLNDCCGHMTGGNKPSGYWILDRCKESALHFNSRKEWEKGDGSAYGTARKNGWLDECCGHMEEIQKPRGYWTLEKCHESALKFSARSEWFKGDHAAYSAALKKGWLDECCSHMPGGRKPKGHWTLEKCHESALKFSTRTEWQRGDLAAYTAACRKGWVDECCGHMEEIQKPRGYWTLERCHESALRFKTRTEWQKGDGAAYAAAHKNGWLEECTGHMPKCAPSKKK